MCIRDRLGVFGTVRGAAFPPRDEKLLRIGKLDMEGEDERVSIVQVTTKSGKTVFEIYKKIGAVFVNDRKRDEKDADMSGTIKTDFGEYMMWGRKVEGKSGIPFTSLSIAPKKGGASPAKSEEAASRETEDEVPF